MHQKILFFITLFLIGCQDIPPYDGDIQRSYALTSKSFQSFDYDFNDIRLHGVHAGRKCNPAILFTHGTPGDWLAWGRYLGDKTISDKAFAISIDRPGFGESSSPYDFVNIKKQAQIIMQSALKEHSGPFLLVGHSYAGPIQIQMALDYPENISKIIILAGPADPELHHPRWYHKLANTWLLEKILPHDLVMANQEMMNLNSQLSKIRKELNNFKTPITVIQGKKDRLVPYENIGFAREYYKNLKIISLPQQGHFIPWEEFELVKEEILQNLTENTCTTY